MVWIGLDCFGLVWMDFRAWMSERGAVKKACHQTVRQNDSFDDMKAINQEAIEAGAHPTRGSEHGGQFVAHVRQYS